MNSYQEKGGKKFSPFFVSKFPIKKGMIKSPLLCKYELKYYPLPDFTAGTLGFTGLDGTGVCGGFEGLVGAGADGRAGCT